MYYFCLLLLFSWMLPLHLPPWISWHKEVLVFLGLGVFAWRALSARIATDGWRARISLPGSMLLPLGLVFITVWQCVAGQIFLGDAIVLSLYFASAMVALGLGSSTDPKSNLVLAIACTFFAGGVLSVGVALAQSFDVWSTCPFIATLFSHRRPGANLTQANQLATLLLFAWSSLLYLYLKSATSKRTLLIGTVWLLLGVAITESRTGLVSVIVLLVWCFAHRKTICRNIPFTVLFSGAATYLACLLWWPIFLQSVWTEFSKAGSSSINMTAGSRVDVWPQLWTAALLKPWSGWGLLNVPAAHNAVLHVYERAEAFSYAHNVVLDIAVGVGLPLSALICCAVIFWFCTRLSKRRSTTTWYCFAVIFPLVVHSMLEYPFAYAFLLLPVLILVGTIESHSNAFSRLRVANWVCVVFMAGFTCLGGLLIREYIEIEEDFRVARFEALRVGQTAADYQRPTIHLLTQLDVMLQATRTDPDTQMTKEQLEILRLATMRFPWTAMQNRYALSLALNGDPAEAARQLKVMRVMHGEKTYAAIKTNWEELGQSKFPQLQAIQLP